MRLDEFVPAVEEFTVAFARVEMLQHFAVVTVIVRNRLFGLCCSVYQCRQADVDLVTQHLLEIPNSNICIKKWRQF